MALENVDAPVVQHRHGQSYVGAVMDGSAG
jgi:hypothetical protein